jgi:ATP-binding cassette, subfamily B, bacterial
VSSSTSAAGAILRATRVAPSLSRGFGVTVLLALLGTSGQIVVPVAVQQMLDRQVLGAARIEVGAVLLAGGIALVALGVAIVATRAAMFRLVEAATTGLAELRIAAFAHVHRLSMLHVQAERRGTLVARVTSDIEAISRFMEWGGVGMIVGTAQVLLVVSVMLVYDPVLAALVVASAALYALLLLAFQQILRRAFDRARVKIGIALGAMGEAISGLPTIRAFGVEEPTRAKVDRALDDQFRAEFRTGLLGAAMYSSAEVFAAAVTAGVVVVGVLQRPDALTAGQLIAFLFLVTLFIEPVQMLVEVLNEAQTAASGIRRVLEVIDTPVDVPDPVDGVALPAGPLSVTFAAVRFRYPTGGDVLRDIDLHLDAGAKVAVVGETGSGKSTFVKLLTRLLDPTAGRVELSGIPIDRVGFASLRDRVVFVPQDGFLFDTSLVANVRYGCPGASDDEVERALAELGLAEWIEGLPEGLQTRVGERGSRLSAGERQLVALTRAWIAGPDLLVLDEATSAVDPALEVRLRRAIARLTSGRTSVTVAHRLSTAEAADEVLVFDQGRVVERGPHTELVAAGGVYAELHRDWAASAGA